MKKAILAATALLTVLAPSLSQAQEHGDRQGEGKGAPPARAAPQAAAPAQQGAYRGQQGTPRAAPTAPGAGAGGPYRPPYSQNAPAPGGYRAPYSQNVPAPGGYRAPYGQAPPAPGAYRGYSGGAVAPSGRGGGFVAGAPRPGGRAFSYNGRSFYRYRADPYYFPRGYEGWAGHQWRQGEWLPAAFIASAFFIGDWQDFGLWDPGYGFQWIRVGPDAVLINLADGQVVDVVPGVYYY